MSKVKTLTQETQQSQPAVMTNLKDISHTTIKSKNEDQQRSKALKLIQAMDNEIESLLRIKCENENEIRVKSKLIEKLKYEYKAAITKLKLIEENEKESNPTIEGFLARIEIGRASCRERV